MCVELDLGEVEGSGVVIVTLQSRFVASQVLFNKGKQRTNSYQLRTENKPPISASILSPP